MTISARAVYLPDPERICLPVSVLLIEQRIDCAPSPRNRGRS